MEEVTRFHSSLFLGKNSQFGMMLMHYKFQRPNNERACQLSTGLGAILVGS